MRKIILSVAVSLDGFVEGPKGEYDWCMTDPDYKMTDFLKRIDTILLGRKTYEMISAMGGNPPGFPKFTEYIFSNTLKKVKKGSHLINGDFKEEIEKIKAKKGKDIWLFGGPGLATSLINAGLLDEIIMAIYPVILGDGKSLFKNLNHRLSLTLLETKTYQTGLITLKYAINQNYIK